MTIKQAIQQIVHRPSAYGPLIVGLDIGIASVGWAVLAANHIVALGTRAFDRAEDEDGKPLNEHRRLMRTARNRLKRRAQRLKQLRRYLHQQGVVPDSRPETFIAQANTDGLDLHSPWALRAKGLDQLLNPQDWARVLYHMNKHRGFYSPRRAETADEASEGGRMLKGIVRTANLVREKWRTLGEMAHLDPDFALHKRNKAGSYNNSMSRDLQAKELNLLFEQQRQLGNPHATATIQERVLELFWQQKPAMSAEQMLSLIGKCTFEPKEPRAAKNSWTAERFIWLSKLANLRVVGKGERRELTPAERQLALDLPYKLNKVSYKQLRTAIGLTDAQEGFAGLSYGSKRNKKGEAVDPEETTLVELKAWHQLRKALESSQLDSAWQRISVDHALLDQIGHALSVNFTDDAIRAALEKTTLSSDEISALLKVQFKGFINLSIKAVTKILPHLEQGLRYDEACTQAGYQHHLPLEAGTLHYVPLIKFKDVRNPVVYRSFNQARKVLNAIIRTYGMPTAVHIEMARDLSKPLMERRQIEKEQKEYQKQREDSVKHFVDNVKRQPSGQDILKYRLYRDQDGQCAYSQRPIDIERLSEPGYCEVDHILPYSRSFDDSMNNKVLVLKAENQNKRNQTPFEYLDGANSSPRWVHFEAWVRGQVKIRKAKRERLLRKSFTKEEAEGFKERNLNDTRYATRLFAQHVRTHLSFAPAADGQKLKVPVLTPSGGFTSFVRARWGLIKVRENGDLHHALDACVIAACTPALQKRVGDFHRKDLLMQMADGTLVDKGTGEVLHETDVSLWDKHFPQPWKFFRDEVQARLSENPQQMLGTMHAGYTQAELAAVRPVFVSRAAKRRTGGAAHQDTVRSIASHLGEQTSSKRVALTSLKLKDLGDIVGAHDGRNAGLIEVLRERLTAFNDDAKKAFAQPICKPRQDGTDGPIIRAVKVISTQKGGVKVRGGVADQASIWRTDVFSKAGKFYLVPIYQSERGLKELPNRASTQGKSRDEWTVMDDTFKFEFSLFPNDLVSIQAKKGNYYGYYSGMDVSTASIALAHHANDPLFGKDGLWRSIGVKTGVISFEKWHVDELGNTFKCKWEPRRGMA